jgi:hypothetical protein
MLDFLYSISYLKINDKVKGDNNMLSASEAVRELKLLRCKSKYNNNEIFDYHKYLNIIEEALCNENCIIVDLGSFNSDSVEECYAAIQNAKC